MIIINPAEFWIVCSGIGLPSIYGLTISDMGIDSVNIRRYKLYTPSSVLGKIHRRDVLGSVGAVWVTGCEDTTVQSNNEL